MSPHLLLLLGMATVIGAIVLLRLHAFLALIIAAVVVSVLTPGPADVKIVRVAEAFGRTAGNIGIVIALAAIIGTAMMRSGAADRIVAAFIKLLGERRGDAALGATGFVLSIPVFFDTVFYLLLPLARTLHGRTGRHYLVYIMAIAAGGAATHTLVPPTPGPLAVAALLGVDLGLMVMMGLAVAAPAAVVGFLFCRWTGRGLTIEPPVVDETQAAEVEPAPERQPGLIASAMPIILPVLLISSHTLALSLSGPTRPGRGTWAAVTPYTSVLGNANFALLLATGIAIWLYVRHSRATRDDVAALAETSLASAGTIILITAAGGAFGASLQSAGIGPAIQALFPGGGSGVALLLLAFAVASLLKIAQGSSTVAMITTAGMLAAIMQGATTMAYHPVYVATAIASGSLVGSWMNDSGFWIFSRMGGVTELQTLRTWTPLLAIVGVAAMLMTLTLSLTFPLQ